MSLACDSEDGCRVGRWREKKRAARGGERKSDMVAAFNTAWIANGDVMEIAIRAFLLPGYTERSTERHALTSRPNQQVAWSSTAS